MLGPMDEERAHAPPPDALRDIDPNVRRFINAWDDRDLRKLEWLLSFDEKKIARFEQWDNFQQTLLGAGRLGKGILWFILGIFGLSVTIKAGIEGWAWVIRWLRGGP